MKLLPSFTALLAALALPVLAAHAAAVTYTGNVTITDTTTNTVVGSNAFSFVDPTAGTLFNPFDDSYSVDGLIADGNALNLNVTFTSPGSGDGSITSSVDYSGLFQTNYIDWNSANTTADLSNGSVVDLTLPSGIFGPVVTLSSCGVRDADLCGNSDVKMYVADNDAPDPPVAPAPEPSSLMLLGTGVLGAAGMIRRKLAL